jgi:hypothetical protein
MDPPTGKIVSADAIESAIVDPFERPARASPHFIRSPGIFVRVSFEPLE